ncbi:MAG: hypothetical protein WCK06_09985 [Actinomycetota bacterium]
MACPGVDKVDFTFRKVRVGAGVSGLVVDRGNVFVVNPYAGEVSQISNALELKRRRHIGGSPVAVATDGKQLWVADRDSDRILALSTDSLSTRSSQRVDTPVALALAVDNIFALSLDNGEIQPFNRAGAPGLAIQTPVVAPSQMVAIGGVLYVLGAGDRSVIPLAASGGRFLGPGARLSVDNVGGIYSIAGSPWVSSPSDHSLIRLATSGQPSEAFRNPNGLAASFAAGDNCLIWVASAEGRVAALDPSSGKWSRTRRVARSIGGLAVAAGEVWLTNPRDGLVLRLSSASR